MFVARMIGDVLMRAFWEVCGAFSEAWGYVMCLAFVPGEKLGLWKLRSAGEEKGAPHMTRRLAVLIQAVALTIEGCAIAWAAYKMVMLWRFGRA